MKKNRRILALLIAMVMMLTDISGIWAASENVQNITSETEENVSSGETKSDSSAEGEGTVGSLVAEELQQEFTRIQAEAYISDLTVEGQTVTVSYATNVQADLAVGIFSEDGKSLLASGHALVEGTSEQTSVQIELSEAPPEYFRASAYLLDGETREPVCEAYNTQYYTSDIQDLMEKTASDFEDTGRMVYLDTGVAANQEENFAVYKDGVVSVEENDTVNILTINADGTWTIESADTTVKSLKKGEIFSFRYKDGMVDALQIKNITVNGDTVTLSEGTDADLGDIFEYVRIHTEGSARMTDMDVSGISSELTFEGVSEGGAETDDAQVETQSLDAAGASEDKVTELDKEKPEISFGLYAKGEKWKAKGSVELSFLETDVDFCLSGSSKYIKALTGWELSLSASFEGSIEKTLEMGYFGFSPVAGVYIAITPVATFKVPGSLEISGLSMHSTVGMRYDGSKQNLSTGPELKKNLRISGSLSVSVGLEIGVTILTEKGLSLKLNGEVGAEIKAGNQGPALSTSVMKHSCANCLDIQINVTVSVEIELTLLGERLMPAPGTFLELTINVGTAYYSVDYDAFGWGECPHNLYKTNFVVSKKDTEQPIADVEVEFELIKEKKETDGKATLNEWQDTAQMTTDENGICTIFLASGDYKAAFNKDSLTAEKEFTVSGKEAAYSVEMDERVYSITYNIKDKKGIAQRGAEVTATDSKGEVTKATADGSGKANLQLIGGAYDIEIHSGDLEKKFTTKVSRNLEMDVKLHGPAYKVTVSVADESGNPVAGANIAGIDSEKENVLDDSAVTDKDGKAEVYLEDGDYTLQVTRNRDSLEGETSITVNGEEQEIAVIVYTKRTITVQIKDESGNPVENAGVIAVSGDKRYDGITDRNGNAELVLGRGTWELTGKKGDLKGTGTVTVEGEDKTVSMTLYAQKYHVEISISSAEKSYSNTCYVYNENGRADTLKWTSYDEASKRTLALKAGRYRLEYWGTDSLGDNRYYSMTDWIQVDSDMTRTIYATKTKFTYRLEGQTLYVDGYGRLPVNRVLYYYSDPDSYNITRIVVGSGFEALENGTRRSYSTNEKNALAKIEEIVLPSTLKVIDGGSFNMFTGLKNMEIPSSVIHMGYNYFPSSMENLTLYSHGCVGGHAENLILDMENARVSGDIEVKNLTVTDRAKTFEKARGVQMETVSLSNGIIELPDGVFYGCKTLQNVKLPEKIKAIPKQAFANCSALKRIEIPGEVTTISEQAFSGCSVLEKIEIPDRVTTIKAEAFGNCESLTAVKLSQNLYSLGVKAFWYCSSLKMLELPASLRVLEQDEKGYSGTFGHSGLVEITIPKTVQETGTSMFEWCSSLERLAVLGGENSGLDKWGYTGTKYPCMEELTLDIPEIGIYSEYVPGLKKLVLGNRVERIPDKAWSRAERLSSGWSKLEEIVWPEHLSYLGDTDFSELTSLKELNMPASIDEYKEAAIIKVPSSLTKMVVSEGIEEIKAYACYGRNVETVILPKSLKKIGDSAFMYASSLKEVVFPEDSDLTTVESCAFWGCDCLEKITLGKKVERIGSWAFRDCKGLKEATIQSGCSGNDDYMDVVDVFWGSDSLDTLTLGSENVWFGKDYGSYYDGTSMENLKHVILLDTVKKVLNGSSESIETVDMGNGVEELGEGAFYRCRNLKSVILSGNLTEIPDQTFKECTSLEEIEIPDGVTHIGILTFFSCSKLKKVELPGSLKTIGSAAFRYCTALKEIELPEGLEKIEKRAFTCTELENVTIPSTVSTIGEHAFENLTIKRICFKKLKGNQLYKNMSKMLQCFAHYFANEEYTDLDDESFHDMIKDDPDFIKALKSINQNIIIYYPSGENISESDKAKANLQYCTWIPYTGSLDDPATFAVLDEESQAVAGDSGFSDGISETETTVADPEADVAEQSSGEEELEVSGEEENFGDGADSNGSDEASVEEAEDSGELVVSELEKPVAEEVEDFVSGSAELMAADAGEASGDLQKQTYTGLVENSNCFFAVVRDKNAKDFFASSNLLFMTQVTSDEDGNVTVEYRTEKNAGIPVLYGPEKNYDLSDAEVTVTEGMIYTGEEQKPAVTVVCGGEVLTEGKDYVLKGDTAFTDAGIYKIKVAGRNDYKGSVEKEYQVAKAGQKMTLEASSRELKVGEKTTITATAIGRLSYASRQPQVASVDAKGVIIAKSAGVASIVVTAAGDKNHGAVKKNLIIFVTGSGNQNNSTPTPAPKKSVLKVTVSSLTLQKKQKTAALKVYGMVKGDYVKSVTSGNKNKVKVISFTKTGKITLQAQKQTGKTTITIRLANGAKKNITVKVQAGKVRTSKISISRTAKVRKGRKVTLKPSLTPVTSQEKVTYASSNKKIVTVTSKGVIRGIRPGKAKITVRSGKKKVVVTVTVTK